MRNLTLLAIIIALLPTTAISQQHPDKENVKNTGFVFSKYRTVDISQAEDNWRFSLNTEEKVREGNKSYKSGLKKIKSQVARRFPRKQNASEKQKDITFNADTPVVLRNFVGNDFDYGVPNDNTVAISNDGILLSSINSNIYMYDVEKDSLLKHISLNAFSDTLDTISGHQYDPKVLYDPGEDRFISVHLAGASSDTLTNIIVGFSQSNDPTGKWNMYKIPGNPIDTDTNWTDFPAIAVTGGELFITGNLLHYGGSWQTSFDESIIWQIDKIKGYSGDNLSAKLWHDITYQGDTIRNIHPVRGGNSLTGPNLYFLSNKNFAVQNDTFFLMEVTGNMADSSTQLTVDAIAADFTYGAPPNAKQPYNGELATNDARVLGAFYQDDKIQFAGNTVDTVNGHATIYHGIIHDLSTQPNIHGNVLNDTLDYGYPNLSYTGITPGSDHAMISFNHSNENTFAGSSAMFFEGNDNYSKRITLKEGEALINMLSGADRWGDYTGSQPKYDHPGRVWVTTSFGFKKKIGVFNRYIQGTWVSELSSQPDDSTSFVQEHSTIQAMKAYPNPVDQNDFVMIEFETRQMKWTEMSVFDMQGRRVKSLMEAYLEPGKHEVSFSTDKLKKGIYLFVIQTQDNEIVSKKIVVN
ncbi:MAG: T9SS type A sorting domain-containing protein [Bacteroidales bacterium]